ncbi:MAG: large conductance mechanosensitive channel protein MscL [Alphaproteobacteria bacterium]
MWNEFKTFIARGNVVDLAVGVIMGAAFGAIVAALVDNVVMPPIGVILGGIDFSDFFFALNGEHYVSLKAAKDVGAPVIAYGIFLNAVIKFIIVAFAVFLLVKGVNKLQAKMLAAKAAEPPPPPTKTETLLAEIRDALQRR